MNIKSVLKKITPNFLVFIRRGSLNWIVKQKEKRQIQKTQKAQILILETIRKKEKVNVIFLAMFDSIWKYDEVYRLLNNDPKFNVKVVVIPHIVNNKVQTVLYNRTLNFFKKNGYFTNSSYDEYNKSWIDIKSILNPDIVFFTLPYSFTFKKYTVDFFLDKLTCYAPYNFGNSHLLEMMHNQLFHNLLWKIFAETSTHKKYSVKYARNKGNNVVITGYPGIDKFLKNENIFLSEWKIKDSSIKKIIWAPHHTIDDNKCFLSYSSFLNYSDFFIKIAKKYHKNLQIAFKPHPLLKEKLFKEIDWGEKKTNEYYNLWNRMENTILVEGNYTNLFLTSDALIHDSGSFLIEYLYTKKPVLHTNRDESIKDRMNSFGKAAFNQHYHAKSENDIIHFIENLLLNKDSKKNSRVKYLTEYLLPPNRCSASENIYNEIVNSLK